jgi:hypothetical protein
MVKTSGFQPSFRAGNISDISHKEHTNRKNMLLARSVLPAQFDRNWNLQDGTWREL